MNKMGALLFVVVAAQALPLHAEGLSRAAQALQNAPNQTISSQSQERRCGQRRHRLHRQGRAAQSDCFAGPFETRATARVAPGRAANLLRPGGVPGIGAPARSCTRAWGIRCRNASNFASPCGRPLDFVRAAVTRPWTRGRVTDGCREARSGFSLASKKYRPARA